MQGRVGAQHEGAEAVGRQCGMLEGGGGVTLHPRRRTPPPPPPPHPPPGQALHKRHVAAGEQQHGQGVHAQRAVAQAQHAGVLHGGVQRRHFAVLQKQVQSQLIRDAQGHVRLGLATQKRRGGRGGCGAGVCRGKGGVESGCGAACPRDRHVVSVRAQSPTPAAAALGCIGAARDGLDAGSTCWAC